MTRLDKLLKWISVVLGLAALGFFAFDVVLFTDLQPRMVALEPITQAEENLFKWTGVGLLLLLGFCLTSLLRTANYLRRASKVTFLYIALIISGGISLLFVFSDVALLSDIGKQYRHGLSQPEWLVLYVVMGFQVLTALAYLTFHLFGFRQENLLEQVALDSNIFLIAQYVGILCGLMGLAFSSLGYIYPRGWNQDIHTTTGLIVLLIPYGLVVGYWLLTKLQEKERLLYDEKQRQDIGKSAFMTLILSVVIMVSVFIANYNNLGGVTCVLWLPIYLYSALFLFSLGNVYFSWKNSSLTRPPSQL